MSFSNKTPLQAQVPLGKTSLQPRAPTAVMQLSDIFDDFQLPPPVLSPSVTLNETGQEFVDQGHVSQANDWLNMTFGTPGNSFDFSLSELPSASFTPDGSQSIGPEAREGSRTPIATQPPPQEQPHVNMLSPNENSTLLLLEERINDLESRLQAREEQLQYVQVERRIDGVLGEVQSTRAELSHLHDVLQSLVQVLVDNQATESPGADGSG